MQAHPHTKSSPSSRISARSCAGAPRFLAVKCLSTPSNVGLIGGPAVRLAGVSRVVLLGRGLLLRLRSPPPCSSIG
jgi:hypothetical protein